MAHKLTRDERRHAEDANQSIDRRKERLARLYALRDEHQTTIQNAEPRIAQLQQWIEEREQAIREMRQEIEQMPARVLLARSRLAKVDDVISTVEADIRRRNRLGTLREKLARAQVRVNKALADVRNEERDHNR